MIAGAKDDCGEAEHRTHREIDASGNDDRRDGHGQQAKLDAEAKHFDNVRDGEEILGGPREDGDFDGQRRQQDPRHAAQPATAIA